MNHGIEEAVARLSISDKPEGSKDAGTSQRKPSLPERWVYGYLMTSRFIVDTAIAHDLPWTEDPWLALIPVQAYVAYATPGVVYSLGHVLYRGRRVITVIFAEDDSRKRLDDLEVTREDMDMVRAALNLPEGTEPKWYEKHGQYPEDTTYDSEEDIDWPENIGYTFLDPEIYPPYVAYEASDSDEEEDLSDAKGDEEDVDMDETEGGEGGEEMDET